MNQSSIEQQIISLTPPPDELSTPHFDDSAVATAHQVEPLPKRQGLRSESSRRAMATPPPVILGLFLGGFGGLVFFPKPTHSPAPFPTEQGFSGTEFLGAPR